MASEDYPENAPVQEVRVRSMVLSHADGEAVATGIHQINGIAWSGQGEITEVSISIDGGLKWNPAELTSSNGQYGWRRWRTNLEFSQPGNYSLIARAADVGGNVQPLSQVWNRGGYGNNMVQQIILHVG